MRMTSKTCDFARGQLEQLNARVRKLQLLQLFVTNYWTFLRRNIQQSF